MWPLVEALLKGEPQGGSVWRSRLEVLGIMVTDATSPFDHLQTTGSIPVERPNHAGRHLDTKDAHDRGVQVVSGMSKMRCTRQPKRLNKRSIENTSDSNRGIAGRREMLASSQVFFCHGEVEKTTSTIFER